MRDIVHNLVAFNTDDRDQPNIWFKVTEDDNYGHRKNWYPQRCSLNAFIKRHNFTHKTVCWNFGPPYRPKDCIIVECTSVWDFFEKIGYDYKKKKFVDHNHWRKLYNE